MLLPCSKRQCSQTMSGNTLKGTPKKTNHKFTVFTGFADSTLSQLEHAFTSKGGHGSKSALQMTISRARG